MPVKKLSDLPQKISSDNGDGFVITSVTGQDMRVPFQNLRENLGVDDLEDKASLLAQKPDFFFVSKYNSQADYDDLPGAVSALPASGGVIVLDNIRLGDPGYTGGTIAKDNISIIGTNKPLLDFVSDSIANDCAVIDGTLSVRGDNIVLNKLCVNTNSVSLEGDCIQLPSSGGTKGASIIDCAGIGYTRNNIYHGLLIENQEQTTVLNWQSIKNVWGIAAKASNCYINGIRAKNHNFGLIVKSDGSDTVENVIVDGIHYSGTSGGGGAVQVENASTTSILRNIQISNFNLDGCFIYIRGNGDEDEVNMSNINFSNGIVDLSKNSSNENILLFNSGFQCDANIRFSNVKGYGAGTNGVTDTGNKFTDLELVNCEFDKRVRAINQNASTSFGIRLRKNIPHNVSTEIFKYSYTTFDYTGVEVNVGLQSTNGFGASSFLINTAWTTANITKTNQAGFDGMNLELTASADTTNNIVTISAVATNTSAQDVALVISVLPRIAFEGIKIIPV